MLNESLGETVGKLYIARHYPPETSKLIEALIADMRAALAERLSTLDWMDETTRKEALAKLAAVETRVGHPTKYVDYTPIKIDRNDPFGNNVRAHQFSWELQLSRLRGPVDRTVWSVVPQSINASNDFLTNQLTFTAAHLQPPVFDPGADPAVNYGNAGMLIGHELSHCFDDFGRQFDATGKIRDWWTPGSAKKFEEKAARVIKQFGEFQPLPGLTVNGELTLGENLADVGGIQIAYAAYRRYIARTGEAPVLNGLNGDQRFFLSNAQSKRQKIREGRLRETLLTDPHSPAVVRVNGVVRNIDAWYAAFDVKPGDKLYPPPDQRVRMW